MLRKYLGFLCVIQISRELFFLKKKVKQIVTSQKRQKKIQIFFFKNLKISFLILGKGDTISFKFLPRLVLGFVFFFNPYDFSS